MNTGWFWYSSPQTFFPLAGRIARICSVLAVLFGIAGPYTGFFVAPTDATQGEVYRVIFIHLPPARMSIFLYVLIAAWAPIRLAFNTRLSFLIAPSLPPPSALFTS